MPLYEYECDACGHRFEQIQKFSDRPVEKCPACGAQAVHKLISSPAIQFKGSGWYITDYARKDKREDKREEKREEDRKDQPSAKAEGGKDAETRAGGESPGQKESTAGKESKSPESRSQKQSRPDTDSTARNESKDTRRPKDAPAGRSSTGTTKREP